MMQLSNCSQMGSKANKRGNLDSQGSPASKLRISRASPDSLGKPVLVKVRREQGISKLPI